MLGWIRTRLPGGAAMDNHPLLTVVACAPLCIILYNVTFMITEKRIGGKMKDVQLEHHNLEVV